MIVLCSSKGEMILPIRRFVQELYDDHRRVTKGVSRRRTASVAVMESRKWPSMCFLSPRWLPLGLGGRSGALFTLNTKIKHRQVFMGNWLCREKYKEDINIKVAVGYFDRDKCTD